MNYKVHIEETGKSKPRPHEEPIAKFLAGYFKSDIVFMRRMSSKTPEIITKSHKVIDIKE